MAAIVQVNTWRVRAGRLQEFMATTASAKKIHERLGGKVVGVGFLVELVDLKGREQLAGYDVQSIITFEGE